MNKYTKDPIFESNTLLPIMDNEKGKRLFLDDVVWLLNKYNNQLHCCTLEIYADGSCNHQNNIGAWAIVSNNFSESGIIKSDNIGYVELYAIYMALLKLQEYTGPVIIYTDSQYAYSNINWKAKEYGSVGWKSKSWRKRIPNKELLQKILSLVNGKEITVKKINRKSNKADKLAKKTMKNCKRKITDEYVF